MAGRRRMRMGSHSARRSEIEPSGFGDVHRSFTVCGLRVSFEL